jgi:hypothetical protein
VVYEFLYDEAKVFYDSSKYDLGKFKKIPMILGIYL